MRNILIHPLQERLDKWLNYILIKKMYVLIQSVHDKLKHPCDQCDFRYVTFYITNIFASSY